MFKNRLASLLIVIALVAVAALTVEEAFATKAVVASIEHRGNISATASYQAVLGKNLNDKAVTDFIASNSCSTEVQTVSSQLRLCKATGMALWIDSHQMVNTVYLAINNTSDFAAYKGELPFTVTANDTMAMVEQKLGQPVEIHAPQAGWQPRVPDEGSTPDHVHYWAIYKEFGLTVIYNSPSPNDKGATIYAILVTK